MGDTVESLRARIEELEALLEEAQEANNDEEVEEAMAIAEKALLEKEEFEQIIERQKQMMADLQLKTTAELLNKEVQLTTLQADLAKAANFKRSMDEKDVEMEALERQIREYPLAFESLKKICIETATTSKSIETQLATQVLRTRDLESQLIECQFISREHSASLQSFQQMAAVDRELLESSKHLESLLRESLEAKEKELGTYREAFHRLSKVVIDKEVARSTEISEMRLKIQMLEESVRRNASYLAPRWQRLADEKAMNKVGSKSAALLRSRDAQILSMTLQSERQFLVSCIPPELWAVEIHIHNVASALARLVYKADNFLEYVHEAHYVELIADVEENPLCVQKDKGFIRWLHSSVTVIGSIMAKVAMTLEAFRESSVADVKAFLKLEEGAKIPLEGSEGSSGGASRVLVGKADSHLLRCLKSGEQHLDRLLDSAENDYLSSSFDLSVLEIFEADLDSAIGGDTPLSKAISSVHSIVGSTDFGIIPPVLSAAVRKLASLAVIGLCGAAYTESAAAALPFEVWSGLWQAALHVIDRMPFGRRSSPAFQMECLSAGFGFLKPVKRANSQATSESIIQKAKSAIEKIQAELCSTTDSTPANVATRLNLELPVVGSTLEQLDQMCRSFAPPRNSDTHLAPWEEAIEVVLTRVCGVTEVEQSLLQLQRSQQRQESDLKKATAEVAKVRQECNSWKAKSSELTLTIERMALYEKELQELRASDNHYVKLLAAQRAQLAHLEKQKTAAIEENVQLATKFNEATAVLEATKFLPRHQHQSEWDALEIANLRAINSKLEREILAAQMDKLDVDLDPSDLAPFLPPSPGPSELGTEQTTETVSHVPKMKVVCVLSVAAASTSDSVQKLVENYRVLRSGILQHTLKIPLFHPNQSDEETAEITKKYAAEHSALRLKLSVLRTRMDKLCSSALGAPVPAQRFLKALTVARQDKPSARITVPEAPWPVDSVRVCKISATTTQLAELHRKLLGF